MSYSLSKTVLCFFFFFSTWSFLLHAEDCAICFSSLSDRTNGEAVCLSCSPLHRFHRDCIEGWFATNSTCPLCRAGNPTIEPLPLSLADRAQQYIHNKIALSIAAVKEFFTHGRNSIFQSNQIINTLWQARSVSAIGALSAFLDIPAGKGAIASSIVGICKTNTNRDALWSYPAMFGLGYGIVSWYRVVVKQCLERYTDIKKDAPIITVAPLVPLVCYTLIRFWNKL